MLKDLLLQSRSFRRFYEDERLGADVLTAAIDAARLCPSARNAQPLKYRLVTERGLGGCIIKAFNAKQIQADFRLPDFLEVRTVLALGRPRETVVIEPMSPDGDYRYWRDAAGVHHVPKRAVEELIWKEEP